MNKYIKFCLCVILSFLVLYFVLMLFLVVYSVFITSN